MSMSCVKKQPLSEQKCVFNLIGEGSEFSLGEMAMNPLGNAFTFYEILKGTDKEHLVAILFVQPCFLFIITKIGQ